MEQSPSPSRRQAGRSRRRFRLGPVCGFCRQSNIRRGSLDSYCTLTVDDSLSSDGLAGSGTARRSVADGGGSRATRSCEGDGLLSNDSGSDESNDGSLGYPHKELSKPQGVKGANEKEPFMVDVADCRRRKASESGSSESQTAGVNPTRPVCLESALSGSGVQLNDQQRSLALQPLGTVLPAAQRSSDGTDLGRIQPSVSRDKEPADQPASSTPQERTPGEQLPEVQQCQTGETVGSGHVHASTADGSLYEGTLKSVSANNATHRAVTIESTNSAHQGSGRPTSFEELSFNSLQSDATHLTLPPQSNVSTTRTDSTVSSFGRTEQAVRDAIKAVEYTTTIFEPKNPDGQPFNDRSSMPMVPLPPVNEIDRAREAGLSGDSTPSSHSPATQISTSSVEGFARTGQGLQFTQAPLAWTTPTVPKRRMLGYFSLVPRARQQTNENVPTRGSDHETLPNSTPSPREWHSPSSGQSSSFQGSDPSPVMETPEKSSRREGGSNLNRFSVMRIWRPWLGDNKQKEDASQRDSKATSEPSLEDSPLRPPRGAQYEIGYGQDSGSPSAFTQPTPPVQSLSASSIQQNPESLMTQVHQGTPLVGQYTLQHSGRFGQSVLPGRFSLIPPVNDGPDVNPGPFLGPPRTDHQGKHTLVLDLDETLVHSSFVEVARYNFVIPVEIEGIMHTIYVAKRPGVDEFLEAVSKQYEVVIFTASLAKYADPLMDNLDPNGYCVWRLFREKCTIWNNQYVKDLSKMGRELKKIVILDNSPNSYAFQPENAIPIESWFEDTADTELFQLIPLLEALAKADDIPAAIRSSMVKGRQLVYGSRVAGPPSAVG